MSFRLIFFASQNFRTNYMAHNETHTIPKETAMNIKTELIALGVRVLADHTSLINKPDAFETTLNSLFGVESYDKQIAHAIESDVTRASAGAKKMITNLKFKQITKNF